MMPIEPGQYHPLWFCTQCDDDFRTWMQLPGEVRREFLRQRPQYDITRLLEDRCPRCGAPYLTTATESYLVRHLELQGEVRPRQEWCQRLHLKPITVCVRLHRGWTVAEALTGRRESRF